METVARALIGAVAGLGGEEEALAMLAHPRADSQFRLAVRRRRVDMIDAVFEQHFEHAVGLVLLHPAERGGAENNARTLMPGFSERTRLDHDATSPKFHLSDHPTANRADCNPDESQLRFSVTLPKEVRFMNKPLAPEVRETHLPARYR